MCLLQAFVARVLVEGDTLDHEQRSKLDALRNPLLLRLSIAQLCFSGAVSFSCASVL
jgi:hypothetical protein